MTYASLYNEKDERRGKHEMIKASFRLRKKRPATNESDLETAYFPSFLPELNDALEAEHDIKMREPPACLKVMLELALPLDHNCRLHDENSLPKYFPKPSRDVEAEAKLFDSLSVEL